MAAWLTEMAAAHPVAAALLVHALVQVEGGGGDNKPAAALANYRVWLEPRRIPSWAGMDVLVNNNTQQQQQQQQEQDQAPWQAEMEACRRRFAASPPHLDSSYLTGPEADLLHEVACQVDAAQFKLLREPILLPMPLYRIA